jgi:hypothetical protein
VAAVVLIRAFHANRRGGGLLVTLTRTCHSVPALTQFLAAGHGALSSPFMQVFMGSAELAERIVCNRG